MWQAEKYLTILSLMKQTRSQMKNDNRCGKSRSFIAQLYLKK